MKITKQELQQIIKEELSSLTMNDYDEDNPPAAEMMADAMQDGLKKLIPGYDMNKEMERLVHDAVFAFAQKLYDMMGSPDIKANPDRYFGAKRK
jgi:hypothetical protein